MQKVSSHFEEYIGRYVMLAGPILTALAAFLGSVAASLGGVNTNVGRAIAAAASAVGTAAGVAVWLRNLGAWQVHTQGPLFDPGEGPPMPSSIGPEAPDGPHALP